MICLAVMLLIYYFFAPLPKRKFQRFYTDEEMDRLDSLVGVPTNGHSRS